MSLGNVFLLQLGMAATRIRFGKLRIDFDCGSVSCDRFIPAFGLRRLAALHAVGISRRSLTDGVQGLDGLLPFRRVLRFGSLVERGLGFASPEITERRGDIGPNRRVAGRFKR